MVKYFSIFIVFLFGITVSAQTYEIGGHFGGANYIGDVGKEMYINPNNLMVGALLKYNRSPRNSYRISFLVGNINGADTESGSTRRNQRGYYFKNTIKELAIGMEYTFWEFDVHRGKSISTPYLFTGFAIFTYDELHKEDKNSPELVAYKNNSINYAIPMAIGYKAKLGHYFMINLELGVRYTFTNNLDGSAPKEESLDGKTHTFGNPNSNDWYVFTGVSFTFAFGRKPCNSIY